MRRGLVVLLAPLMFSAAVVAQTPLVQKATPETVLAKVSPDEVVSRLLTFDRDQDGKVAGSELAERMQSMLARADTNRDGALDVVEIRAIASAPPAPIAARQGRSGGGGFPFGGSYGFADESSFSSRNQIEGAIEDLKLAADAKEEALAIAKTYVDTIEAEAEADLLKDLNGVLTPEQIIALQESLKTRTRAVFMLGSQNGEVTKHVVTGNIQPHINQFRLAPDKSPLAQKAADRYTARVKMSEAERLALVDRLRGVLNVEERENLRAALARRPVVATGGIAVLASLLNKITVERIRERELRSLPVGGQVNGAVFEAIQVPQDR